MLAMTPSRKSIVPTLLWGWIGVWLLHFSVLANPEENFDKEIKPLLEKYCFDCHGPEKQKGGIRYDTFTSYDTVAAKPEFWKVVLEVVMADEMPPEGAKQWSYGQRQDMMRWLRDLPKPELDCNQIASDRTQNFYRGYVMSRRLNRHEYSRTLRDLFDLNISVAEILPSDGSGGEGFDNNGDTLFTSSLSIERYLEASDRIMNRLFPTDDRALSKEEQAARERILLKSEGQIEEDRTYARTILERFAYRAYRRPVEPTELDSLLTLFDRAFDRGDSFEIAIRLPLRAILISPHFLFLAEPEPEEGGVHPLGPFPLASKLSYFLWASIPDDELLKLAASGELMDEEVYLRQIHRMLQDPKSSSFGERFAVQWLQLEELGTELRPDERKFPEFNNALAAMMKEEVKHFFNYLIKEDRSLLELIDSDYSFVNDHLASLYGLEGIQGSELQKVNFQSGQRGGVLGMAAVHAATSYPLRTSPVLRGKWVLEVLLGDRVPPPPPDVPALAVNDEHITTGSLREQLEMHRTQAECAACHNKMDPLGFGLEHYDVLGRWRSSDGDQQVDATGVLPSGESFSGPAGLKGLLLERKDKVIRHLVKKMTGYAFGRELNKFDECVIKDGMTALEANAYRPSVLIESIAASFQFRHRFYAIENQSDES